MTEPDVPEASTPPAAPLDESIAVPATPAQPGFESDDAAKRAVRIALLAVLCYLAFDFVLPLVPYHARHVHSKLELLYRLTVFHVGPTALFMLLQVWLAQALVGLRWSPKTSVKYVVGAIAIWAATFVFDHYAIRFGLLGVAVVYCSPILFGTCLTIGLTALGVLLSRIVREKNVLLPVALVAMPIDYIGAMTSVGFTNSVVRNAPDVVANVSVHVPTMHGLHMLAMIGPGDALFIAFFFAVVQRFEMNMRGTFWWMFALLTIAMAEVIMIGFPVAALVPMGIAVLAANWRYFTLKREEVFAMMYAILIVLAIVIGFYLASHRYLFHGH